MISNFFQNAAITIGFLAITTLMVVMFYYLIKGAITGKCSSGLHLDPSQRWLNAILTSVPVIVILLQLAVINAPH